MIAVRVLRIRLCQQRTRLNALVEFTGDVPEIGRGDFESFSLADPVTKL